MTQPKARVLMMVANLPVPPDRRVWHEAQALTDAGYAVSVICPTGKGFDARHEVIEGIEIFRYRLPLEAAGALGFVLEYGVTMFWALVLSLRVAFTRGFDILHACNPPDLYFILGLFYRPFGKRFVFDHHDVCPELYEVKFRRRGAMYRLQLLLEKLTFKTAHVVLATNESFKAIARQRGQVPEDRIFIVRSAPNLSTFRRVEADPALRGAARFVLGYVGIMGSQDGVESLLQAMAVIVAQRGRSDFRAVLVGDGPEFVRLQALATQLQLNDVVQFTGYQTGEALLQAYSSFDIGVIPDPKDVYNDKITMNKTLEFMAMGIPFALFPLEQSGIDAGAAGLQAKANTAEALADAILTLADDPSLYARMRAAGHARTAELSWDAARRNLLAAYARVS